MMKFLSLIPYYFSWHYTDALINLFNLWGNLTWFIYNYFSFEALVKTFFLPLRRSGEKYLFRPKIEKVLNSKMILPILILFGMVARGSVIIAGLFVLSLVFFLGTIFFIVWFILPILITFLFVAGLIAVFNTNPK